MTDWEKYAIIGTALASGYLILKPKKKLEPEVTYKPPTPPPTPAYVVPPPKLEPAIKPIPEIKEREIPKEIPTKRLTEEPIYKKREIEYPPKPELQKEIPIKPKLISVPEQEVQKDIDELTEHRDLYRRLKALQLQRDIVREEIIAMTIP